MGVRFSSYKSVTFANLLAKIDITAIYLLSIASNISYLLAISMLSNNKITYIRSLELKMNRNEEKVFVAEGHKLVNDLMGHFPCRLLTGTAEWFSSHPGCHADEVIEVGQEELSRVSLQKTPQEVLAIFEQPVYEPDSKVISKSLCLALDNIQDPGNLGTIIRLADWFGIEDIFCSTGTVDVFNPKTVQATMGAIARVKVHYCDLPKLISSLKGIPVYGTFLDGNVIYSETLSANGLIVMGNEGNGISREVEALINRRLYIPNYPQERETSESLNVAIATAVVCAEFRRRLR